VPITARIHRRLGHRLSRPDDHVVVVLVEEEKFRGRARQCLGHGQATETGVHHDHPRPLLAG
jgi:hypothetical protein